MSVVDKIHLQGWGWMANTAWGIIECSICYKISLQELCFIAQYNYTVLTVFCLGGHELLFTLLYVLLKALPPVCMKYTAPGESRVANRAGSWVLYLSRDPH